VWLVGRLGSQAGLWCPQLQPALHLYRQRAVCQSLARVDSVLARASGLLLFFSREGCVPRPLLFNSTPPVVISASWVGVPYYTQLHARMLGCGSGEPSTAV
jgi:hypothetical protein